MSNSKPPDPIGNETEFSWGPVIATHRIGPYAIVEHGWAAAFNGSYATHAARLLHLDENP